MGAEGRRGPSRCQWGLALPAAMRPSKLCLAGAALCCASLAAADAAEPTAIRSLRQLQASNDTNRTAGAASLDTPCVQAIKAVMPPPEQCQIDYQSADCDRVNLWTWETLNDGWICLHIFGVLVMFLALSIVCDEFFVPGAPAPLLVPQRTLVLGWLHEERSRGLPDSRLVVAAALEVLVRRWAIDPDIAGATFMAAGGSAPELFTSFIGTFQESSVGFGTIVGSAVFNVLFVIGTCAVCSKEALNLTWWPLARDCSYYITSLLTLAILFGSVDMRPSGEGDAWVELDGFCYWREHGDLALPKDCAAIKTWEASLLFAMYFGYCIIMKYNRAIAKKLDQMAQMAQAAAGGGGDGGDAEEGETVPNPAAVTRAESVDSEAGGAPAGLHVRHPSAAAPRRC